MLHLSRHQRRSFVSVIPRSLSGKKKRQPRGEPESYGALTSKISGMTSPPHNSDENLSNLQNRISLVVDSSSSTGPVSLCSSLERWTAIVFDGTFLSVSGRTKTKKKRCKGGKTSIGQGETEPRDPVYSLVRQVSTTLNGRGPRQTVLSRWAERFSHIRRRHYSDFSRCYEGRRCRESEVSHGKNPASVFFGVFSKQPYSGTDLVSALPGASCNRRYTESRSRRSGSGGFGPMVLGGWEMLLVFNYWKTALT